MKTKLLVLISIFVLYACVTPVMAQAWRGHGRVTGNITDTQGSPIEGVTIKFSNPKDKTETEVKSDQKGNFVLAGIRGGNWNVDFIKDGYKTVSISTQIMEASYNEPLKTKMQKEMGTTSSATGGEKQKGPDLAAAVAGRTLMDQKDYKGAIAKFQEALTANPNIYQIYGDIGTAYAQMGDYDNAVKSYETYIEKEKAAGVVAPDPKPRIDLANIYLQKKDFENAKKYLALIDESQITDPTTFYNVGVSYYNTKDYDNAIKYFQKSVTVDPKFEDGFFQLGLTYVAKNNNAKAIENFKKVIEIDPTSESAKEAQEFINSIK